MIHIVKDCSDDLRMPGESSALIAYCPTHFGNQEWGFAGGAPAAQLESGVRPLGWSQDDNTCNDWITWYETREDAFAALAMARMALDLKDLDNGKVTS